MLCCIVLSGQQRGGVCYHANIKVWLWLLVCADSWLVLSCQCQGVGLTAGVRWVLLGTVLSSQHNDMGLTPCLLVLNVGMSSKPTSRCWFDLYFVLNLCIVVVMPTQGMGLTACPCWMLYVSCCCASIRIWVWLLVYAECWCVLCWHASIKVWVWLLVYAKCWCVLCCNASIKVWVWLLVCAECWCVLCCHANMKVLVCHVGVCCHASVMM